MQTNDSECPKVENINKFKKFFEITQDLIKQKEILSYHDVSDGGLIVALLEAAFAGHVGIDIDYNKNIIDLNNFMFNEELGVVMQVSNKLLTEIQKKYSNANIDSNVIAKINNSYKLKIFNDKNIIYDNSIENLHKVWHRTSYEIQRIRDNAETAENEFDSIGRIENKGLLY